MKEGEIQSTYKFIHFGALEDVEHREVNLHFISLRAYLLPFLSTFYPVMSFAVIAVLFLCLPESTCQSQCGHFCDFGLSFYVLLIYFKFLLFLYSIIVANNCKILSSAFMSAK